MQAALEGSLIMSVKLYRPNDSVIDGLPRSLTLQRLATESQTNQNAVSARFLTEGVSGSKWVFPNLANNTYVMKVEFAMGSSALLTHLAHIKQAAFKHFEANDDGQAAFAAAQAARANAPNHKPGMDLVTDDDDKSFGADDKLWNGPKGRTQPSVATISADSYVVVVSTLDAETSECDRIDNTLPEYYDYCNDDSEALFQPENAEDEKWYQDNRTDDDTWLASSLYFNDHHGWTCEMIVKMGDCGGNIIDVNRPALSPEQLCCGCGGGSRSQQNKDAFEAEVTSWEAFIAAVTSGIPRQRQRRGLIGALEGSSTSLCYSTEPTQIKCSSRKVNVEHVDHGNNDKRRTVSFQKPRADDAISWFNAETDDAYAVDDKEASEILEGSSSRASYTGVLEFGTVTAAADETILVEVAVESLAQTFVQSVTGSGRASSTLTMEVVMYRKGASPTSEEDLTVAYPGPVVLNSIKTELARHGDDDAEQSVGILFENAGTGTFYFAGQAAGKYSIDVVFTLDTDFKGGDVGDDDGTNCLRKRVPQDDNPNVEEDDKAVQYAEMLEPALNENEDDFVCRKPISSTLTVGSHSVVVTTFTGDADKCSAVTASAWSGRRQRRGVSGSAEVCHGAGSEVTFKTTSSADRDAKRGTMVGNLPYGTVSVGSDERMLVEVTVESMAKVIAEVWESSPTAFDVHADAKLSMGVMAFARGGGSGRVALPGDIVVNRVRADVSDPSDDDKEALTSVHLATETSRKGIYYFPDLDAGDYDIQIRFTMTTDIATQAHDADDLAESGPVEAQVWIGHHVVTVTTFVDNGAAAPKVTFVLTNATEVGATELAVSTRTQNLAEIGDVITFSGGTVLEERATVSGFGSLLFTPALKEVHPAGSTVQVSAPGGSTSQASSSQRSSSSSDPKSGKGDRKAAAAFAILSFFLSITILYFVLEKRKQLNEDTKVAPAANATPPGAAANATGGTMTAAEVCNM
jgi:hypothetical protein